MEGEEFDEMRLNKLGGGRGSHGKHRLKAKEITTASEKGGWDACKVLVQKEEMPHLLLVLGKKQNGAFPRTAPYPLEYLWLPVGQESGSTSYKNVLKPFCGALALLRVVPECEVL